MTFSSRNLPNPQLFSRKITDILNVVLSYCIYQKILLAMAAVPQGAFAARKIRQNEEKLKQYDACDLTPTKYSSKFMNSVWGMYNRYSVHNFKKNIDEQVFAFSVQQQKTAGPKQSAEKNSADFRSLSPPRSILPSAEFL